MILGLGRTNPPRQIARWRRSIRLGSPPLVLALAAVAVLGLSTPGRAFTLFSAPIEKASIGAADGDSSTSPGPRFTVTDDGCQVVFTSDATNLVPGDANGERDVFLYDGCGAPTIILVSHVGGDPGQSAKGRSDQPVISPDGQFVVFRSTADDIVPEDDPDPVPDYSGQTNVFVWDRANDKFSLVSHRDDNVAEPGDKGSQNAVISRETGVAARRIVAFESLATNLVGGVDNPDFSDVFRYDVSNAVNELISLGITPVLDPVADGGSFNPAINLAGDCIVFESEATNLVSDIPTNDVNNQVPPAGPRPDIFRWGLGREPTMILLSHEQTKPNSGRDAVTGDGPSTEPSIADNCEHFAFKSAARNLALNQIDANGGTDVFRATNGGDAILVSHEDGTSDVTGSDPSLSPILSRDGGWIAYASLANNLSPGQDDTASPSSDVFVYRVSGAGAGRSTLVSHTAVSERTVGSGESFAPEISMDGLYIAYESGAKDLDPNQNDGNGGLDVFLYNRRWNNNIVASQRFASIAITGERRSRGPALSASGYSVAFTGLSADHIADDPETSGRDDVFVFRSIVFFPGFVPFISVRSGTDGFNVLEWITPSVNYASMRTFKSATCPSSFPPAGATEIFFVSPPANTSFRSVADGPYAPGTTVCYSMFVETDAQPIGPGSPMRTIVAHTPADPAVQWATNLAGIAALSQVGIGLEGLVAVAQEGGIYGITRGSSTTGGFWPASYWPFRTNLSPIQGRPSVVPFPVLGSSQTTFVGSQDGRVYALDANLGARRGGALWYTTPPLGQSVQPGVSGMFTVFGGIENHVLVGARTGSTSQFFALNAATGARRTGGVYTGAPSSIGAINTAASVDYPLRQVYFASLEFPPDQPSLWCLELDSNGLGAPCWAPVTSPDGTSGSAVPRSGRLYVGDDSGDVWAFDTAGGTPFWGPQSGCGSGIKSFVLADRQGTAQDLYFSASAGVCAITDDGAPIPKWTITSIPNPSAPILARIGGVAYLYVGSTDGRLYQILADAPSGPNGIKSIPLRPGSVIGAPAFDVFANMVYVGSETGSVYAVQAPFP